MAPRAGSAPTLHRRKAVRAFSFLALAGFAILAVTAGEEKHDKPRLKLIAEPAVGFTPVTTVLTGQLSGVRPDDAAFCHPAVTWVRVNPGLTEDDATRYREDAACRHPPSEAVAVTSFTKTLTLQQPGSYLFKLVVEGRDGQHVESAYTRVQVLRVQ